MNTIKHFLKLAAPFWFTRKRWADWLLLAAVIGFALAIIRVSVWITEWNKTFYDALADFNGSLMPALIVEYLGYIGLIVIFIACGNWLRKTLLFRWRRHLTRQFQHNWLTGHKHYRLQLAHEPDNPDQRIAEDIYLLSERSIDLFKYFIMNAAKLIAFVTILWQLSGTQNIRLGSHHFVLHGYLVWVALIYSAFCTLLTHLIGRKLKPLNVERQHREADYRATLLRVRDHAEQIASYRGESTETQRLNRRFDHIQRNWRALINREFKLESFTAAYLRISMFIPIFATLPMYLARSMTFGDMMQARSAFSNVQDGFGWFMDYYKRIMEWAAIVERLANFQHALEHTRPLPQTHHHAAPAVSLQMQQLTLHDTEGRKLMANLNFAATTPEWLLLKGRSGIGKSTLLRTLAGLWPYYSGTFTLNSHRFLFLPQRPYLPQDSLRAILSYPHEHHADNAALQHILQQVGLPHLHRQLDNEQEWYKILSGGEQQRISIARALLHRPEILFLDEATNQLDDAAARQLMQLLKSQLPDALVVAVSHQSEIIDLFEQQLDLNRFQTA